MQISQWSASGKYPRPSSISNEALVTNEKLLSSFGKNDHVSMKIELGVSLGKELPPQTSVIKKPNWSKVSVNEILDYSYNNIDWYPTSGPAL